jgi:hypothetical protein
VHARTLARIQGAELIRLQCYEGIDATQALYEWDYARQLLHARTLDATTGTPDLDERTRRRMVLLVDVSGSMAIFTRALLLFAHAALHAESSFEAFAFGTRLTRLTAAFAESGPDAALARAAERDTDWDGGTRIGESIGQLVAGYDGLVRGAVIVVLSDGLDVGDPERLRSEMERLARLSHRIVWLNPLKENPHYAPLARGMRAALPLIDHFDSGHDFHSLERLAATIGDL